MIPNGKYLKIISNDHHDHCYKVGAIGVTNQSARGYKWDFAKGERRTMVHCEAYCLSPMYEFLGNEYKHGQIVHDDDLIIIPEEDVDAAIMEFKLKDSLNQHTQ